VAWKCFCWGFVVFLSSSSPRLCGLVGFSRVRKGVDIFLPGGRGCGVVAPVTCGETMYAVRTWGGM
jgi:hypothetical protein